MMKQLFLILMEKQENILEIQVTKQKSMGLRFSGKGRYAGIMLDFQRVPCKTTRYYLK